MILGLYRAGRGGILGAMRCVVTAATGPPWRPEGSGQLWIRPREGRHGAWKRKQLCKTVSGIRRENVAKNGEEKANCVEKNKNVMLRYLQARNCLPLHFSQASGWVPGNKPDMQFGKRATGKCAKYNDYKSRRSGTPGWNKCE